MKPSSDKVRIVIDFDDVLFPLLGPWIAKMGLACDPPLILTEKDWTEWDLHVLEGEKIRKGIKLRPNWTTRGFEYFGNAKGGPAGLDDMAVGAHEFFGPDLYDNAKPYAGAVEAVAALAKLPNTELICATSHSREAPPAMRHQIEEIKKELLRRDFPALADNVQFISDKKSLNPDVIIDDGPHNLSAVLEEPDAWLTPFDPNPNFKARPKLAVLIKRAWNTHEVEDWKEDTRVIATNSLLEPVPDIAAFAANLTAERRREQFKSLERVPVTEVSLGAPKEKEKIL